MDKSSKKQNNAATEASSSKAAAAVGTSKKQGAETIAELAKINRTLLQLEIEHVVCWQRIDDNLDRREDLVRQICLLVSTFEKHLVYYDQAENARRKIEVMLSGADDGVRDVRGIVESAHDLHEDVVRAKRRVRYIRAICEVFEPQINLRKMSNEAIHTRLCEKLVKIERSRQAAIARRKQLLTTKMSMKNGK